MSTVVWADMMRWWGLGGALLGIFPLYRSIKRQVVVWTTTGDLIAIPPLRLVIEKISLFWLLLFSIIAGTIIPLTTRITGFHIDSPLFLTLMAAAWTCAGIGSWCTAAAFSANRYFTTCASLSWFVAMFFAITATGA